MAPSCPLGEPNHSAGFGSSCPLTELVIYVLGYLKDSNAAAHSVHKDILRSDSSTCAFQDLH